ncbi:MAG: NADH:ubiquinone reductase (Na(+)-transporting) subunit B [Planctomycetaceae bacterium]|nr:NADH:ubiquinone reductase (Na(+)-transporting) subunit B [Planctomycetaceae bacterium]
MKPLRNLLDRVAPLFEEGGKASRLYPLYEALDTFLYSPDDRTSGSPHVRDAMDLKRIMSIVVIALLPCTLMAFFNTGYQANLVMGSEGLTSVAGWRGQLLAQLGVGYDSNSFIDNILHGAVFFLPAYIVTMTVGGLWEVLFACVRKHEVNEGFLVTGLLFPLTLPPTVPLWQVAIGVSFGVVIGKEVFGGTGRNILNPALTARAFLFFAYPANLSGDAVWTAVDGYTGATSLGALATAPVSKGMEAIPVTWWNAFLGLIPGSMGETSTLACLFGAAVLIATGIGSWRIMAGMLISAMGFSTLLWLVGSNTNPMFQMPPWWHFVVGGYAFGLVFMATDPVSSAMTDTGRWFYGALIGVLSILIRVINPAYPEGVMLAILFGNVMAPLIDYFVIQANVKRRVARNVA